MYWLLSFPRNGQDEDQNSPLRICYHWWMSRPIQSEYSLPSRACTHILRLWGYYATVIYLGDAKTEKEKVKQELISIGSIMIFVQGNFEKWIIIVENSIQTTQVNCWWKLPLNHWEDGKNSLTHLAISHRPISCSNEAQPPSNSPTTPLPLSVTHALGGVGSNMFNDLDINAFPGNWFIKPSSQRANQT